MLLNMYLMARDGIQESFHSELSRFTELNSSEVFRTTALTELVLLDFLESVARYNEDGSSRSELRLTARCLVLIERYLQSHGISFGRIGWDSEGDDTGPAAYEVGDQADFDLLEATLGIDH